jgi:hypothetical protein
MSKISIMERKSFEKLIGTRRDTLLNALNGNLLSNKEDLIRDVLLSKGHKNNSEELNDEINKVESKITDIVSEHLEAEQAAFDVKIADAQESIDEQLRNLCERYNLEKEVLEMKKRAVREDLLKEHKSFEDKIAAEKVPELVAQKKKLEEEKRVIETIEQVVDLEVKEKMNMIRKMKYRIENGIRDKTNKALEDLLGVEEREDAKLLLESIPTVSVMIVACQNMGGINDMINNLSPRLALPMPNTIKEKVDEAVKTIEAEVKVVETDEEEIEQEEREAQEVNASN